MKKYTHHPIFEKISGVHRVLSKLKDVFQRDPSYGKYLIRRLSLGGDSRLDWLDDAFSGGIKSKHTRIGQRLHTNKGKKIPDVELAPYIATYKKDPTAPAIKVLKSNEKPDLKNIYRGSPFGKPNKSPMYTHEFYSHYPNVAADYASTKIGPLGHKADGTSRVFKASLSNLEDRTKSDLMYNRGPVDLHIKRVNAKSKVKLMPYKWDPKHSPHSEKVLESPFYELSTNKPISPKLTTSYSVEEGIDHYLLHPEKLDKFKSGGKIRQHHRFLNKYIHPYLNSKRQLKQRSFTDRLSDENFYRYNKLHGNPDLVYPFMAGPYSDIGKRQARISELTQKYKKP